ncbi:putative alkaline shock family protein YloU [Microbacterium proteolyticum]|uniref:Putative alkaline shock family protein YloU n=1 Tax=Microbacterium proteolyticum TaxID=1572644 RepID=A0A7W5CHG5_9MICO|nr:Asp23/Gls24 family envelope stress response protein [Microbacterium proteolyticum]MBB3157335.1 putative alkaline shock family protein YloU [Microbacterium proteolyticum]
MADNATTPAAQNVPQAASRVNRPLAGRGQEAHAPGKTTIAEGVVAKVAGIAAREVAGVYALGGGGARALGAIRDAINATDLTQGVKVEVGETQAAADITIVVEYGAQIQDVAEKVRSRVAGAIGQIVGLDVVEVNVDVNDVHVPGDDDSDDADEKRVR